MVVGVILPFPKGLGMSAPIGMGFGCRITLGQAKAETCLPTLPLGKYPASVTVFYMFLCNRYVYLRQPGKARTQSLFLFVGLKRLFVAQD